MATTQTLAATLAAIGLIALGYPFLTPRRWQADASTPGAILGVAGLVMCFVALLLTMVVGFAPGGRP